MNPLLQRFLTDTVNPAGQIITHIQPSIRADDDIDGSAPGLVILQPALNEWDGRDWLLVPELYTQQGVAAGVLSHVRLQWHPHADRQAIDFAVES
jgi:hypothetical protein